MKQSADNFSCVVQGVDKQALVLQRDHVTNFVQEVGSKDAELLVDLVPQRSVNCMDLPSTSRLAHPILPAKAKSALSAKLSSPFLTLSDLHPLKMH